MNNYKELPQSVSHVHGQQKAHSSECVKREALMVAEAWAVSKYSEYARRSHLSTWECIYAGLLLLTTWVWCQACILCVI